MGLSIAVSIRITGVLVISSLIVLPVATAMQFKKGFKHTLFLSIAVGLVDVLLGLVLSNTRMDAFFIFSVPSLLRTFFTRTENLHIMNSYQKDVTIFEYL